MSGGALRAVGMAGVAAVTVAGCTDPASRAPADCSTGVLFREGEYVAAGRVGTVGAPIGEGTRATCEDVGRDARGSVFDGTGKPVSVVRVPGIDPEDAIAVEFYEHHTVLINQALSEREQDEIVEALGLER